MQIQELNFIQGTKVKNYVLQNKLGEGSFSVVYKAIDAKNPKIQYAIKIMKSIPENNEYAVKNEIMLLKKINHKNVIKCFQDFTDQRGFKYIVLEHCGKGDLLQYFKKQGRLPQTVCRKLAQSIIDVFSHLHQKKIVHRDLKLANILITDKFQFKIADFGMAKFMDNGTCQTQCGTPYAMPPQILKCERYDGKCDVWSLGVMIYQLIYGRIPFSAKRPFQLRKYILEKQPNYDSNLQASPECINFIKQCLKKNKDSRPSMTMLKKNKWFDKTGETLRCQQFLRGSMQEKTNKVIQKTKQMLVEVMKQHLKGLIKQYKLTKTKIQSNLNSILKYEKDENLKQIVLLVVSEQIKHLTQLNVCIKMGQRNDYKLKLSQIKVFKDHLHDLQQFLKPLLQTLNKNQMGSNFLIQLINFTLVKAEKSLGLQNQQKQYLEHLYYVCKLPLYLPQDSKITIQWAYDQILQMPKERYNLYLNSLKVEQVLNVINSNLSNSEVLSNWLIEHNYPYKRRQGGQFTLGEYMVKILQINSKNQA